MHRRISHAKQTILKPSTQSFLKPSTQSLASWAQSRALPASQAAESTLEARQEVRARGPPPAALIASRPCDPPAQHGPAVCPACLCTGEKLQINGGFTRGAIPAAPQPSPHAPARLTRSSRVVRAQDVAALTWAANAPARRCPRTSPRRRAPRRRAARRHPRRRHPRRRRRWGHRLGRDRRCSACCQRAVPRARLERPLLRRAQRRRDRRTPRLTATNQPRSWPGHHRPGTKYSRLGGLMPAGQLRGMRRAAICA